MENKVRKNLKYYLITAAVSLGLGIGFFCLFFFLRGPRVGYGLVNWQDSAILVGIILISVGGLMAVGHEGFFDIFAYGFKQIGSAMFSKNPHAYNDFPGYRENKKAQRSASPKLFISVLIVGAVFFLASLCIYLAYIWAV